MVVTSSSGAPSFGDSRPATASGKLVPTDKDGVDGDREVTLRDGWLQPVP